MALPRDEDIQRELLVLLANQPTGTMHCQDAWETLAKQFPNLTKEETKDPYRNSQSHWANRVQFAAAHLKEQKLMMHHTVAGGIGIWKISNHGREWLDQARAIAKQALAKFRAPAK